MSESAPPAAPPQPSGRLDDTVRTGLCVGAAALLLMAAVIIGIGIRAALTNPGPGVEANSRPGMMAVSPGGVLAADDVPDGLHAHYRAAADHYEIFQRVPCFCGCQEMLGHRHLGDCFIRPDGQGLEAHAVGCGVCLGEAEQVEELMAAGTSDVEAIRTAVVAEWGDPYLNR